MSESFRHNPDPIPTPYQFKPQSAENVADLDEAFAKAQGEYENVKHTKTVETNTYEYSYAELGDIMEMLRKPLSNNGLAVLHFTRDTPDGIYLETRLKHTSGQWIATELPVPPFNTPQGLGSLISYLRRYSLGCLAGVVTEKDEGGELGSEEAKKVVKVKKASAAKAKAKPPRRTNTPTPPSADATSLAQLKVFWIQIRAAAKKGGFLDTEAQVELAVKAMVKRAYSTESTREISQGARSVLLKEFTELYGPNGTSPKEPNHNG